jgi:hypothetical protein
MTLSVGIWEWRRWTKMIGARVDVVTDCRGGEGEGGEGKGVAATAVVCCKVGVLAGWGKEKKGA